MSGHNYHIKCMHMREPFIPAIKTIKVIVEAMGGE